MRDEEHSQLPEALADLVREIGWEAARKLTKKYGGVRLYMPMTVKPEHPITMLIGMEAALKLSALCGGERGTALPKSDAFVRTLRNNTIRARRAQGESARTLALDYALTESMIYQICGEREVMSAAQLQLFGG